MKANDKKPTPELKEQIKEILDKYCVNGPYRQVQIAEEIDKLYHSEGKIEKAADEILNKHYSGQSISMEGKNHKRIWFDDALKAMQEYADLYHKDKLKDELVKFTIFISKMDYKDAAAERVINEYLKTKG